jgi:hypothetical protein
MTTLVKQVASVLLGLHAVLLARGAWLQSPTLNEPGHLVAGISNWQFGRFDVYKVNPPLVRMAAAVPVLVANAKSNWDGFYEGAGARPEFSLGEDFVAANGERSMWLFTLARWACIPFSLLGGYVCFRWAGELYGDRAGLLALALWCFCPNILGHGQLMTPDGGATALAVAACYTFWRWLREPTWWHALGSGAVLGLAELAKTTLVIFYPLWFALWVVYRCSEWRQPFTPGFSPHTRGRLDAPAGTRRVPVAIRELCMLALRMLIAIYVVNLGYGFEGSGTRLGEFRFVSATLGATGDAEKVPPGGGNRLADSWLGALPVPLPRNYVLGIDLQRKDFEDYNHPSYLRGEFRDQGWWYYYLYAMAIKVPLGSWLLLGLAATRGVWWRFISPRSLPTTAAANITWRDEFILLSPAIVILAFVSSQTGFSEHMRYVLPIFPFFFIWIGRVATVFDQFPCYGRPARLAGPTVILAALAWLIGSSLSVYPHSLSYFNELVGGPKGGHKHLIHSNVDWGQDLLFLKQWLDKHPEATPLKLAYFGYFDPIHAGIEYTAPQLPAVPANQPPEAAEIPPGWYAISVNFVQGLPYFAYNGDAGKTSYGLKELARFQRLKPVAMAGYSIYIFYVPARGDTTSTAVH